MKEKKGIEVRPVPDPDFVLPYPRLYSNFVAINSSPFDFTLRFCDALPLFEKPTSNKEGAIEIKIPIQAEIVLPKEVFFSLIKTMQEHYDKYNKAYAEVLKKEKEK